MLKKLLLSITCLQVLGLAAFSQNKINEAVLKRMALQIKATQDKNYEEAVALAAKKGWPLSLITKSGGLIVLTGIDEFKNPVYTATFNNTIAAATTRTNQLWPGGSSGLNLTGSSDAVKGKLGIWDGGAPLTTHVELAGRVTVKDGAATDDHATHTSGTLIASGVNPIAKGMAYGAQQLISYNFTNDALEMTTEAPNLLLSNHSYGNLAGWNYDGTNWSWYGDTTISRESYLFGRYGSTAQLYDSILYNAPYYLACFSAGNSRNAAGPAVGATYKYNGGTTVTRININNNPDYGSVALNATAKNILLVGAVNGLPSGYQRPTDVSLADFSSAGATDDGRIKPDVVADGVNVTSSSSASNTAYESLSGTSMACPNTTGSLYLLQEYYTRLHPGNFMRAATLKALAIHTADEAGNTGPDYYYGWGLLNVLKAANVITSSFNHRTDTLIEKTLDNGTNATYSTNVVASGNGMLMATIVWNDPPGTVNNNAATVLNDPTPKLVHDLDLRITRVNGGSVYLPWVLNKDNPSAAATKGDNTLDNVEQVVVTDLIPGESYTITVGHKGTLARSTQPFSLIISGIGGTAYCASNAISSAGTKIDSVAFAGISNKNSAGCTTYTNYTNVVAQVEPNKTLPLTVKLSSCDASTNPRVVKVYIDYNNDGLFNETTELVASGTVAGGTQTFTANITTPSLITGNSGLMRIVAQETSNAAAVSACGTYANGETQDYKIVFAVPGNDLLLQEVTAPENSTCASGIQYLTIKVKNNGSTNKSNLALTATVKSGSATVATFSGTYPATAAPGDIVTYTFQTPFVTLPGTTYSIEAVVSDPTDQNRTNDTLRTTITIAPAPATPAGEARICGTTGLLRAINPSATANYFWYSSATSDSPIASGSVTSTTVIPSGNTYYLSTGAAGNVGLATNSLLPNGGGYLTSNSGNYMSFTASVPAVLENARLYTKYPGKIDFIVADIVSTTATSYTYQPISTTTIDVYSTSPNPAPGAQAVYDPQDNGAVFNLNLFLPVGSHAIIVRPQGDANIFRNNNVTGNPYPFTLPGVISFTGNSAASPNNFQNFYYYLYNMRIHTTDCISAKAAVIATVAPVPVITQSNDSLVSSIDNGNQWYLNGSAIGGATGKRYKPAQNGTYTVTVTDNFGCQQTSTGFNFLTTAVNPVANTDVSLKLWPNPNNGTFTVRFKMATKADLRVELINVQGQTVFTKLYPQFIGDFSETFKQQNLASGMYVLRLQHGADIYYNKMFIQQ